MDTLNFNINYKKKIFSMKVIILNCNNISQYTVFTVFLIK